MYITLDSIVRNVLMNKRYSIHFYIEFLNHGKDILRELTFDMLKMVNTDVITLDSNFAAKLPCDYQDFTKVGVPLGQYVRPLLQYSRISRLNNYDANGNKQPYGTASVDNSDVSLYSNPVVNGVAWCFLDQGRWYGYGTGRETDVFKVIKERGVIQLDEHFPCNKIVLEYISDGSSCDAASQIDPYAQKTIEAYILWQIKSNNRTAGIGEVREAERMFTKERDTLASRLSDITLEDVKRVYRRAYYGAMKN